jgi:hypothetical protein
LSSPALGVSARVTWQGTSASARPEQQAEQPLCPTIVSEIERISPLPHQHIHAYDHCPFNVAGRPSGYRPPRATSRPVEVRLSTPNRV